MPKGQLLLPAGAQAATFSRASRLDSVSVLTSGQQSFHLIYLEAGTPVTSITFVSGSQAAVTPTAQWFSLYDASRNKLAVTADDTTTAWGSASAKPLTVAGGPYIVPVSANYYLGIMVAAATVPNLLGPSSSAGVTSIPPIVCGRDGTNTGLTTPATAPATAAALTTIGAAAYAYVS